MPRFAVAMKGPLMFAASDSIRDFADESPAWSWRRHPDSNRGIRVLQTLALPLGYAAILRIVKRFRPDLQPQREPLLRSLLRFVPKVASLRRTPLRP